MSSTDPHKTRLHLREQEIDLHGPTQPLTSRSWAKLLAYACVFWRNTPAMHEGEMCSSEKITFLSTTATKQSPDSFWGVVWMNMSSCCLPCAAETYLIPVRDHVYAAGLLAVLM